MVPCPLLSFETEVTISLSYQLCSTHNTMNNCSKSTSVIKVATIKKYGRSAWDNLCNAIETITCTPLRLKRCQTVKKSSLQPQLLLNYAGLKASGSQSVIRKFCYTNIFKIQWQLFESISGQSESLVLPNQYCPINIAIYAYFYIYR